MVTRDSFDPEIEPIALKPYARQRIPDGLGDEIDPGDMGAGLVGEILRDHAAAAAQVEHAAAGGHPAGPEQVVKVRQVGEAVLAQVAAIDAGAILGVGGAAGHRVVKRV